MLTAARWTVSKLQSTYRRSCEKRRLQPLYDPDSGHLDLQAHLQEAVEWLRRAQDAGADRGVSYGARFGGAFQESYPETTGYICRTFVELSPFLGDSDLLVRAIDMGVWEADVQLPNGAVMGGKLNREPSPAVFNTGMVMLGWNALIRVGQDERFRQSCMRAADWLVSMQESDGNWIRGNSQFASAGSTIYNVKAAWGLCEAGYLLGRTDYIEAAIRNAEFCISRQASNGWFADCCLTEPEHPLLHTLAYTVSGLLEVGRLTGRRDFIEAARKTADAQIRIMGDDGFLPGRQDRRFRGHVGWCCLTGSAQTSVIWSELYRVTGERQYARAATKINRYLMARHDIRNRDATLRGGLPGSWPTSAAYGRFTVLNWATKFLVDALFLEQQLNESIGDGGSRGFLKGDSTVFHA